MGGKKAEAEKLAGERQSVLPVGGNLKSDEAVAALPAKLPPVNANSDWPQHSGNTTAATGNLAGGEFNRIDNVSAGEGNAFEHALIPPPVVAGGLVFAMDATGKISAHDAANIGNKRWQSSGVSEEDEPLIIGGGLAWAQGKLYALSGRGLAAAFDAQTGGELWRKQLNAPFRSAPRVEGGKLFAISIDSQLYALDSGKGEVLWTHRGISEIAGIMSSVAPAISGNTLIVPYPSGELYGLSQSDGSELWNAALSSSKHTQAGAIFSGIGGDQVVDGEVVFAVSSGGTLSVFAHARGQRLWELPIASLNTPWVAGDYLYVLGADNTLICFVKYDGRVRWSLPLESYQDAERRQDPIVWRGPVMANGRLVLVGSHGKLLLIDAQDGKIAASHDIQEGITSDPVIAGGRMYLVGKDATLYSLQ
jgi:outer membrane protein assembly factor BamB